MCVCRRRLHLWAEHQFRVSGLLGDVGWGAGRCSNWGLLCSTEGIYCSHTVGNDSETVDCSEKYTAVQSCGLKVVGAGCSGNPQTQWWMPVVKGSVRLKESY